MKHLANVACLKSLGDGYQIELTASTRSSSGLDVTLILSPYK